jgi:hypothetical protein
MTWLINPDQSSAMTIDDLRIFRSLMAILTLERPAHAGAGSHPEKPMTLVVPLEADGSTDVSAWLSELNPFFMAVRSDGSATARSAPSATSRLTELQF